MYDDEPHYYEVVAEVRTSKKMEAPHSDDGDGFNLNGHQMETIDKSEKCTLIIFTSFILIAIISYFSMPIHNNC